MMDQILNFVSRIFLYIFSSCPVLFIFDNTVSHTCFAENTFLVKKMNLGIGKKQLRIKNRFINAI